MIFEQVPIESDKRYLSSKESRQMFPGLEQLELLDKTAVERAMQIANQIKAELLLAVRDKKVLDPPQSLGQAVETEAYIKAATDLSKIMFNRFRVVSFDDIFEEMKSARI